MIEQKGHILVLKTGPGTTIQDLGRKNWTKFGIPNSGPCDFISAEWVNHVLRNDGNCAVLEISQPGVKMEFHGSCMIALAGAKASVLLDGEPIPQFQRLVLKNNSVLEVGAMEEGSKVYLGVRGGFQTPLRLGSRSYFQEITPHAFVQKGDQLPYISTHSSFDSGFSVPKWDSTWFQKTALEFYPGPDYQFLSHENREKLLNQEFTVSQFSSRMGTLLTELLENDIPELPTNPVYPGIVQLTSGGKLIVLGRDAQVTGGYPRIMFLTELSQAILAQKRTGQKIRFIKKQP
ncbi:5-oxoprolinase subunit C family protein [Algoriphagus mannitolivorans]|uniref:5-oxoprolinase subunit C family protein n=1 Tax=Algoriphagus mannitolivorans TaxID=226504 RepID=UPI000405E540|nr:biotin-dependent carboxyltransferase family protein [Algoriphagus mannitolivorans]